MPLYLENRQIYYRYRLRLLYTLSNSQHSPTALTFNR